MFSMSFGILFHYNSCMIFVIWSQQEVTFKKSTLHLDIPFYHKKISSLSYKLLLLYSKSGKLLNSHVICTGLCLNMDQNIDSTLIKYSRSQILHLNERYFFNINKKQLQAYILYTKVNFRTKFEDLTWDLIFREREYAELDKLYYCWTKQMLAYELAKLHNVKYIKTRNFMDHGF